MGSFKATLSEAERMASPKAGPRLWRARLVTSRETRATGKTGRRRSTRAVQCPDANGRHAWRRCQVLRTHAGTSESGGFCEVRGAIFGRRDADLIEAGLNEAAVG